MITRRAFLQSAVALSACARTPRAHAATAANTRTFHACLSSKVVAENPHLLARVRNAGVTDIWQAAWLYGHWYETPENLLAARKQVEDAGLRWHLVNIPFGHPGDALGDSNSATPITPPGHWRMAERPDGSRYSGTSLHPPGTEENVKAVKALAALNPDCIFLDDDFRLATGPGVIGGCFCAWHKKRFLDRHGYEEPDWESLLADIADRKLSPLVRAWVENTCDELSASFHAQQAAAPDVAIGNMIMYLGAEKAGIRLKDYIDVPFRVGELMFNDKSFDRLKGKTDELFSALFHRRFAKPDLAWSETTAYPADQLSAENMAAKLVVSTLSDVRNTMYMSGLSPIPETHWDTLAPAMREQARLHDAVAGHVPKGPLKHYWGEAARYVGDDKPFSLFLALGIPFEVCDEVPEEGWTFLCDADAQHLSARDLPADPARIVCRPGHGLREVPEELADLWPLKHEILKAGLTVPHVVDEKPVVCAWYPDAATVILWNLSTTPERVRLRWDGEDREVALAGLGTALVKA